MIFRDALISDCKWYRYKLYRSWVPVPRRWVLWVMLNPSIADGTIDDRTITRCIGFSKAWGYDGLMVGNLFAYRSTDPNLLPNTLDPIGPDNAVHLQSMAESAELIIVAWGSHSEVRREHAAQVLRDIRKPVHCLGLTLDGQPRHPLRMAANLKPQPFINGYIT